MHIQSGKRRNGNLQSILPKLIIPIILFIIVLILILFYLLLKDSQQKELEDTASQVTYTSELEKLIRSSAGFRFDMLIQTDGNNDYLGNPFNVLYPSGDMSLEGYVGKSGIRFTIYPTEYASDENLKSQYQTDVLINETGTYFDSRQWLSLLDMQYPNTQIINEMDPPSSLSSVYVNAGQGTYGYNLLLDLVSISRLSNASYALTVDGEYAQQYESFDTSEVCYNRLKESISHATGPYTTSISISGNSPNRGVVIKMVGDVRFVLNMQECPEFQDIELNKAYISAKEYNEHFRAYVSDFDFSISEK